VFTAPPRFVIDLVGQANAPGLPGATGEISAVRFGRHPDHVRVVIETRVPIESGRVAKSGRDLTVTLDYAR
jgi:hypothetical protein